MLPHRRLIVPSVVEEQLKGFAFDSVYEPFAGEGRLSRYFKRRGKRVVAGDLLESRHSFLLALVENEKALVPPSLASQWLAIIKDPAVATRFQPWANRHFTPEETIWLGIWHAHLASRELEPPLRAIGAIAVALTMRYWLSFDLKAHPHKPMSPPVAFQHYLQTVNTWVCNSGRQHQALWGDAYGVAPRVEADLLFCYPPPAQGFQDAPLALGLFEAWVQGDPQLPLPGLEGHGGPPTLGTPLSDPSQYREALRRFLARCEHLGTWAVALDDRSMLDEASTTALIKEFRPVLRRATLPVQTGTGGRVPAEILLIAQAR